jgi:hypothetical protein
MGGMGQKLPRGKAARFRLTFLVLEENLIPFFRLGPIKV